MKKILALIAVAIMIVSFTACGDSSVDEETNDVAVSEESVNEDSDASTNDISKQLEEKYGMTGGRDVRNDTTGGWTIDVISSSEANDPSKWAVDYVNAFWEEGNTVKWIVNFANNTTTSINNYSGDKLNIIVTQREYVDGEEHDANVLGGGMELQSWNIYYDDNNKLVIDDITE